MEPGHTQYITKAFFVDEIIDVVDIWSPNSPDLSPIEVIWSLINPIMFYDVNSHQSIDIGVI